MRMDLTNARLLLVDDCGINDCLFATQADTGSLQYNTVNTVQCERIKAKHRKKQDNKSKKIKKTKTNLSNEYDIFVVGWS